MLVIEVLVVAVLLVGVAAVAAGRGGSMSDAEEDAPDLGLPDDRLSSEDVTRLRFRAALRGYRMSDVDDALDRLQRALAEREEELRMLRPLAGARSSVSATSEPFEPVPSPEPFPTHEPEPVVPGPEPVGPEPEPVHEPEPGPADEAVPEQGQEQEAEPEAEAEPDVLQRLRRAADGHD